MQGRTCLVTGASSGIGLATAVELSRRGATVAIVGRSPERTASARQTIESAGRKVHAFVADFSSLQQVRQLAQDVMATLPRLDVLINNAGLWHQRRTMSHDGYEDTFAVNHLAPFLLSLSLLPMMRGDGERRLVHVSSRLHEIAGQKNGLIGRTRRRLEIAGLNVGAAARLDLDDLQCANGFDGLAAYARSKLAQIMFSNELARRMRVNSEYSHITSNSVHPGSVNTSVVRDSRLLSLGIRLVAPALKTPAQGAATSVYVATSQEVRGVSGRYFANSREVTAAMVADDESAAQRLWDLSAMMVDLTDDPLRK